MLTQRQPDTPTNLAPVLSERAPDGVPGRIALLERQIEALTDEHLRLLQALQTSWDVLNQDGALDIVQARITASHGIIFPATQNPSSDANTLDDYEEGTWTPAFTFGTPGNLSVAYSTQQGSYTKVGRVVVAEFNLVTSSFTHTTASGNASITGLPVTVTGDAGYGAGGGMFWSGITKASYTQVTPFVLASATAISLLASGSGVAAAFLAAGDFPTAGTVQLRGTLIYRV